MKMKIDFICVGAQKAGTTAISNLLKQHSGVQVTPRKEVHFFDRIANYEKGLEWYSSHFSELDQTKKIGELTPDYLYYSYVPTRIKESLGTEIKIWIVLRNPVLRTFSQYNFYRLMAVEFTKPFLKALPAPENLDKENSTFINWHNPTNYIERSLYWNQVKRYYDTFGKENVHICVYEDFFKKGEVNLDAWNALQDFIGVERELPKINKESNVTFVPKKGIKGAFLDFIRENKWLLAPFKKLIPLEKYKTIRTIAVKDLQERPAKLDENISKELYYKYFEEDVKKLEELTGMDFSVWKPK
jgi:hypothetical protein